MRITQVRVLSLFLFITLLTIAGCSRASNEEQLTSPTRISPAEIFLEKYDLKVKGDLTQFTVEVPQTWEVPLGAYPEGLYWGLANEFSKDVGLDLTPLKGKTVQVSIYPMAEGLFGEGNNAQDKYPTNVILLLQNNQVVGSWLSFNTRVIGPSVRKHTLQDLTGLTFEQWVDRKGYFSSPVKNGDLANLTPAEVLDAFFAAINKRDETRANACLSPVLLRDSLTMNLESKRLYNPSFNANNSYVNNIIEAKPISYKLVDFEHPATEIKEVGDRKRAEIFVTLYIKWRDSEFNTPNGQTGRFAILNKYANGWKLEGLNTGP